MISKSLTLGCVLWCSSYSFAQDVPNPRPITLAEYQKAKTFTIPNLDTDTYLKIENTYILDRYESRKPYFVTGDDGLKKRIDLYKVIAKEGMQELGLLIFYTNESGKVFQACMPNFTADSKVWEQYFADIDNINKTEKNYILKLSYILSKEMGFQLYKALNQGKDLSKESATYGNDVCFPGTELVTMADGSTKILQDIKSGDEVVTVDPLSQATKTVKIKELTTHEAKNYAIMQVLLIKDEVLDLSGGTYVRLSHKILEATPNHPMKTAAGNMKIADIQLGEQVLCLNSATGKYESFSVQDKREFAGGNQKVYNMVAEAGDTFIMNGVMVRQKP
jgi:hypothetical protein